MRGRPNPPHDFVTITADWLSRAGPWSTVWNIFAPGSWLATTLQLETLLGDFFLGPVNDLLQVLPTDTSLDMLRCSTYGNEPQEVQYAPAFNVGAIGDSMPLVCALCLTWRTSDRRIGAQSHTHLALADDFVDEDRRTLKSISWSEAQSAARSFVLHVNGITSPDGAQCVAAVVHTSRDGVALGVAEWSPVLLGDASRRVAILDRRRNPPRPFSSG